MKKVWMGLLALSLLGPAWLRAEEDKPETAMAATASAPAVIFGGLLDTYYIYNFPNSTDGLVGQGNNSSVLFYNGKDDSLSLGLAELSATATFGKAGFHLTVADGISGSVGQGGAGLNPANSLGIDLLQAYLSYNDEEWSFRGGRFVSWLGREVIESRSNWNYTHSLLFQYTRPYWNTGLGIRYMEDPTFQASAYAVDGWNGAAGSGIGKTYGFQTVFSPAQAWQFTINGMIGPGSGTAYTNFAGTNAANFVGEAIILLKTADKLSFALDAVYVGQDVPGLSTRDVFGSGVDAWGMALYGRYQLLSDWAVAVRLENLEDSENMFGLFGPGLPNLAVAPAKDLEAREATFTIENSLTPNILLRLEGRYDAALSGGQLVPLTNGPFIRGSVADQADQIIIAASAVVSF